jgi:L-iditol 2-dehydrogenase
MASIPDRMRALVQRGRRDLRVEEQPVPQPRAGEILVRVRAVGICGSDLHTWREAIYGEGVVMGHEICGEVAALGEGVSGVPLGVPGAIHSGLACGRCAHCESGLSYYCREAHGLGSGPLGGFGEYLVAPAGSFLAAPSGADDGAIAFCEPLANGLRALDFPEARQARSAVVIGAGPIGLACLIAARQAGVERIVAIEGRARRREAALALGAERVLDPGAGDVQPALRSAFPLGADLVVEAVGLPDTIRQSFRWARPRGTVVLLGLCLQSVELRPIGWLLKELTIRSSLGCSHEDQRRALAWLASGAVDPAPLVTRRIGLEEAPGAFAALASGADEIKVVVEHARG